MEVDNSVLKAYGSAIYIEVGEIITLRDLLYGLMLRSGNDCAETLAVYHSKNIQNFANVMNMRAKKLGATNSSFKNPHGLHNDEHYTTAIDLAKISAYAMKNEIFKQIVWKRGACREVSWLLTASDIP